MTEAERFVWNPDDFEVDEPEDEEGAEVEEPEALRHGGAHTGHGGAHAGSAGGKKRKTTITLEDGTTREVTVHEHGGARILVPKDLDTKRQKMGLEDVKAAIDQVPAQHRGVIREVRLLDTPYTDRYGRANTRAAATYYEADGRIEFHRNSRFAAKGEELTTLMAQTMRHEAAHGLTDQLGEGFVKDWKRAAKKDGGNITDYAKTDIYEDIAETIAHHWSPDSSQRRVVARFFPERAKVLTKYEVAVGGS